MSAATTAAVGAGRSVPSGLVRYVVLRVASAVLVLWVVSVVVFLFIHFAPGGPEYAIGGEFASAQTLEAIRVHYGLNDPFIVQYLRYVESLLQLDFGQSYMRHVSVLTSIADAAKITVPLLLLSWLISMGLGIGLGIVTAARPGGWADRLVLGATTLGASAPVFAVGTLLAYVFGIKLGWLPVVGAGEGGTDRLRHLILPATTKNRRFVSRP